MIERESSIRLPCDADEAKQALLRAALVQPATLAAANELRPADADETWEPGSFELAVGVRACLAPGFDLEADDFDGHNIEALKED